MGRPKCLPIFQHFHNIADFPKLAGDTRSHRGSDAKRLMDAAEIVYIANSATASAWFSTFFENALVSRVTRRVCILIFSFCRSA